jgi:hypothetical protein
MYQQTNKKRKQLDTSMQNLSPQQVSSLIGTNGVHNKWHPNDEFFSDVEVGRCITKLRESLFGEKDLTGFCYKVCQAIVSEFVQVDIAGCYLNASANMKHWMLCYAHPSPSVFTQYFSFGECYKQIVNAIFHNHVRLVSPTDSLQESSLPLPHTRLPFVVVPICASEPRKPQLVMVLGTLEIQHMKKCFLLMDKIRPVLFEFLQREVRIVLPSSNSLSQLETQNDYLKNKLNFTKSLLLGLLSSVDDISVICTNTKGVITYFR